MAEERTLGLARARETTEEDSAKEELQRRMEAARDSISNTVTEIKENVAQQYENVKDALDWREHFKRNPVAWSLGAAGVGLFVGYGIAAALKGDDGEVSSVADALYPPYQAYAAQPAARAVSAAASYADNQGANGHDGAGKDDGPSMLDRFRETSAYDRLSKEAGALGDRLVEELSTTAQQVVLPALLKKVQSWIGIDLSKKTTSPGSSQDSAYRSTVRSPG
ncbi:MAG: hypothetical protein QOD33_1197 [Pyrinomonadaceae bacterium]|jgi:hypothetical protein|nr:hypothetical protein [Pyrinomonadaceae bacterium]